MVATDFAVASALHMGLQPTRPLSKATFRPLRLVRGGRLGFAAWVPRRPRRSVAHPTEKRYSIRMAWALARASARSAAR